MSERRFPDMWADPEDDPREQRVTRGERDCVLSYLGYYRRTLQMKCDGLDAEQLARRSVPPSNLSLLGLIRHMARVEHSWFTRTLQQVQTDKLYWRADAPDLDFDGAVADDDVVRDAWASWKREVAAAEAYLATGVSFDDTVLHHGERIEVRDILVHMVEEYARHCGHADLLREAIDGRTGQ